MYKYFVSYSYSSGGNTGVGNMETHYGKEIRGIEDVTAISRKLEKDNNLDGKSVVILNFIKLN